MKFIPTIQGELAFVPTNILLAVLTLWTLNLNYTYEISIY